MRTFLPRVTVATVVCLDGRYLMVEERDKSTGVMVINQPAGHLEEAETLTAAAARECLEETRWQVSIEGFLGVAQFKAPNGLTYIRSTFVGAASQHHAARSLDPDIHQVHWWTYEEIFARSDKMLSPLVLAAIEQHRNGTVYPLNLVSAYES